MDEELAQGRSLRQAFQGKIDCLCVWCGVLLNKVTKVLVDERIAEVRLAKHIAKHVAVNESRDARTGLQPCFLVGFDPARGLLFTIP